MNGPVKQVTRFQPAGTLRAMIFLNESPDYVRDEIQFPLEELARQIPSGLDLSVPQNVWWCSEPESLLQETFKGSLESSC